MLMGGKIMRELLVKNRVSQDKRQRELFLAEHYEKGGVIQEVEKKTVYKVREILEFTHICDLETFLNQEGKRGSPFKRFIIKNHSTKTGTLKIIYKIIGEQYVILKDKILVVSVSQYVKKILIHRTAQKEMMAQKKGAK